MRYRAATFFGRLYAPEILMGMKTSDEIHDTYETESVGGNYIVKTTEGLQPDNARSKASPEPNKPKKQSKAESNDSIPVGDDNDQGLFEGVE